MEWTTTYIVSQIFAVIMYTSLASTYFVKKRVTVIILNFIGSTSIIVTYVLLGAYSGLAMAIILIIRNIIFLIDNNKEKDKNGKKDFIILGVIYVLSILAAIYTYEGFLSLFSVFAAMINTYSIWQKDVRIYKLLGIPNGILWIIYNVYILSISSIIAESILLVCSTSGYFLHKNKEVEEK